MHSRLILFWAIMPITTLGKMAVRFAPNGVIPENGQFSTLACSTFRANELITQKQLSTFRVGLPEDNLDFVNVSIFGENMTRGHDLYVMPLTAPQTLTWTGIWLACPLLETSVEGRRQRCIFGCQCSKVCEEIQVSRKPRSSSDNAWTLCYLCMTYWSKEIGACEGINTKCIGVDPYSSVPIGVRLSFPNNRFVSEVHNGKTWQVIMRRLDGSVNFNREWQDYKCGFGQLSGEYWAGNEALYNMTSNGLKFTLRVDLEYYDGERIYAEYGNFWIGPESDKYRLHVSGYKSISTAVDALSYHNNMKFSTPLKDNDEATFNCASIFKAGWWFNRCKYTCLSTAYGNSTNIKTNRGIIWGERSRYARFARMMMRPNMST